MKKKRKENYAFQYYRKIYFEINILFFMDTTVKLMKFIYKTDEKMHCLIMENKKSLIICSNFFPKS